jgi:hypothetical protein
MDVARFALRTVLKRRILSAPRIASAPGSSSPFSTSVTALTSLRSLESCVASETLLAALASCNNITPQQMTMLVGYYGSVPKKPRHTVAMTVGLLVPKPRKSTADETMVALVKYT